MYGKKLEEFAPPGPIREEAWKQLKEIMEKLASVYDRNGEDKLYFLSDTFSFADAFDVSYMLWVKIVFGEDSEEWKAMASWSDGRWGRLVESMKALQTVD